MADYTKIIVCLANSRKPPSGDRCVVGKEKLKRGYGDWIRPVSPRSSSGLSTRERHYQDGNEPRILDFMEVPMIGHRPALHQTENHVIDSGSYWRKTGEFPWADLPHLLDSPESLWSNGNSTNLGLNDQVTKEVAAGLQGSLFLIKPETLTVSVQLERKGFPDARRRVRAEFRYKGTKHILVVTDPVAEKAFFAKDDGHYRIANTYLCVSLAGVNPNDGFCYKLVAAIISKQML